MTCTGCAAMASRDCPVIIEWTGGFGCRRAIRCAGGPGCLLPGPAQAAAPDTKSGPGDGCKLAGCLRTGGGPAAPA